MPVPSQGEAPLPYGASLTSTQSALHPQTKSEAVPNTYADSQPAVEFLPVTSMRFAPYPIRSVI